MVNPIVHTLTHRRPLTGVAVAMMLAVGGCVGAVPGERDAFDRWQQHHERTYQWRADAAQDRSAAPADAPRDALPDQPTLDDYVAYAVAHHPGLEAQFHEWQAALHRMPQARALMDPQLSYSVFVRQSMNRQSVSLSQAFPWYGRLRAEGEAALAAALAAERRFERERQEVIFAVRDAFAQYAYLGRSLAVLAESRRILDDVEAAARARFEAGDVPYADLIRAGVAVEQIADGIESLEASRAPLVARLNAAMGRPTDRPLPLPDALPQSTFDADDAHLLAALRRANPELQALRHEAAGERHSVSAARQNRIPDLTIGVEYMDMVELDDQLALMASINLPIWNERSNAERSEALAAFGAATRRQVDRRNELEAELRLASYRFRDADRRSELYRETLVPMAREAMDAAEAAYAAGQTGFDALTQTQTALQELQLTRERIAVDRFEAIAELERLVGRALTDLPTGNGSP